MWFFWEYLAKMWKSCEFSSMCMSCGISYWMGLTLIGMRQGTFTPLVILGLDFVSWIYIKNFQTFLEVKIDINWVNLTPCQAPWVLWNLLLGGAKDEHFFCSLSSCQLGSRRCGVHLCQKNKCKSLSAIWSLSSWHFSPNKKWKIDFIRWDAVYIQLEKVLYHGHHSDVTLTPLNNRGRWILNHL